MKAEWKRSVLFVAVLSTAFVFLLILPISSVLRHFNIYDVRLIFERTDFVQVFLQSVFLSVCVSVISVVIALLVSIFIREQKPLIQKIFIVSFTMSILVPTVSMGMGIMHFFSRNGFFYQIFGWRVNIFGFNGLLLGMVLNIAPLAILQIYDVLRYEDTHLHVEAKALRLNPFSRLCSLSLPRLRPAIKRAFFATFLFSFTDFGINLMVGGQYRTLSLTLYQEIIGRMNFSRAAIISVFMWAPLIILYIFCMRNKQHIFKHNDVGTTSAFFFGQKGRILSCVLLIAVAIVFLFPIITFVLSSFRPTDISDPDFWQNYRALFHMNFQRHLINSLIIATGVAIFGTILSFLTAYVTSKIKLIPVKALNLVALVPFSVPGLVLGLGFVMSYISHSNLFNTFIPLICAILINFFGVPYILFLNNFSLMGDEIETSAKIFKIGRFSALFRIYLPQMKQTIIESIAFYFVNSMITISVVVVMFRARTMPLSIVITQFEGQLMIFRAAAVTTIILLINITIKVIFYFVSKQGYERAG